MEKIKKTLDDFFKAWKDDKHSRYLSWEHCYSFFKNEHNQILNDKEKLDLASLNLAFYLASWGMYRGSSNLLWKDYKIHEELIKELLSKCDNLFNKNENIKWEQIEQAKNIIETYYKKHNISLTDTLITKVLMGIFGCVPAYDNFFKNGLRQYNNEHGDNDKIPITFNEKSFNKLNEIADTLHYEYKDYPKMRLIDAYFW